MQVFVLLAFPKTKFEDNDSIILQPLDGRKKCNVHWRRIDNNYPDCKKLIEGEVEINIAFGESLSYTLSIKKKGLIKNSTEEERKGFMHTIDSRKSVFFEIFNEAKGQKEANLIYEGYCILFNYIVDKIWQDTCKENYAEHYEKVELYVQELLLKINEQNLLTKFIDDWLKQRIESDVNNALCYLILCSCMSIIKTDVINIFTNLDMDKCIKALLSCSCLDQLLPKLFREFCVHIEHLLMYFSKEQPLSCIYIIKLLHKLLNAEVLTKIVLKHHNALRISDQIWVKDFECFLREQYTTENTKTFCCNHIMEHCPSFDALKKLHCKYLISPLRGSSTTLANCFGNGIICVLKSGNSSTKTYTSVIEFSAICLSGITLDDQQRMCIERELISAVEKVDNIEYLEESVTNFLKNKNIFYPDSETTFTIFRVLTNFDNKCSRHILYKVLDDSKYGSVSLPEDICLACIDRFNNDSDVNEKLVNFLFNTHKFKSLLCVKANENNLRLINTFSLSWLEKLRLEVLFQTCATSEINESIWPLLLSLLQEIIAKNKPYIVKEFPKLSLALINKKGKKMNK